VTDKKVQRTFDTDPTTGIGTERDMNEQELEKFYADLAVMNAQLEARTTSE
jgi:hypothetical protein